MRALLVVDEQNDFSTQGRAEVLQRIRERVAEVQRERRPIAWLRHRDELGPKTDWLRDLGVTEILVVGFEAHTLVSRVARELLSRGLAVSIDPDATAGRDIEHSILGQQTADDVRLSALLHLTNMGVTISKRVEEAPYLDWLDGRRGDRVRSW